MDPLFTTPVAIALTVVGLLLLLLACCSCKRRKKETSPEVWRHGPTHTPPPSSQPSRPRRDPPIPWSQPQAYKLQNGAGQSNQQGSGQQPRPVPCVKSNPNTPVHPPPTEPSQNRSVVFEVEDEVHSPPVSLLKRSAIRKHLHPTCRNGAEAEQFSVERDSFDPTEVNTVFKVDEHAFILTTIDGEEVRTKLPLPCHQISRCLNQRDGSETGNVSRLGTASLR